MPAEKDLATYTIDDRYVVMCNFVSDFYSNIIAGKDTRVGVGFRMGPNMDAQVIVEVGPQANTEPLVAPSSVDISRRQTENRNDITDNGIMTTASWTMHKLKNALKQWFSMVQKGFAKSYNSTEAGDVDDTRTFVHTSP